MGVSNVGRSSFEQLTQRSTAVMRTNYGVSERRHRRIIQEFTPGRRWIRTEIQG
jgi:hypothetical protein